MSEGNENFSVFRDFLSKNDVFRNSAKKSGIPRFRAKKIKIREILHAAENRSLIIRKRLRD